MELRDACALTNLLHTHAHTHTFLKLILNFKTKVLMFCVTFRQITLFSLPLRRLIHMPFKVTFLEPSRIIQRIFEKAVFSLLICK